MSIKNRIQEFRVVPKAMLLPNPKNWRTHPEAQRAALRGVLDEVGIADAVIARKLPDGRLMLVDGHLRLEELPDDVPTLILDVNEAEADKLLASMDPLAAMAQADASKLDALLRDVQTAAPALADMFTELAEEAGLLDGEAKEVTEDEVPEPPADPITKPGDLWLLGDHRLLCGDSRKADDVARLMDGAKACIAFTSPPYNVSRTPNGNAQKYLHDSDDRSGEEYLSLLVSFTELSLQYCSYSFVNLQSVSGNKIVLIDFLHSLKCFFADYIIWDKLTAEPAMARRVLNSRFEFVYVFSKEGKRTIGTIDFRGTLQNIVQINSRKDKSFSDVHKATFPVEFAAHFVREFCSKSVLDLFCGSGTTLIAAEQLGRKCYGMEISPQYCDVIVKRWETLTGKKAIRG